MIEAVPLQYFLKKMDSLKAAHFEEVYSFSELHLKSVLRRSGENYFVHGSEVARTFFEITPDLDLAEVLLLHDLLVHPNGSSLLKKAPLSKEQKKLVEQMHALRRLNIDANTQDLDYVINEFSSDGRLLILRMAHRLNDVRHIKRFDDALQKHIAHESLHMYTAIAGRLGLHAWRYEMEDRCFHLLYPEVAEQLERQFEEARALDETCLQHTQDFLTKALAERKIKTTIQLRIKSLYSTYRKMAQKKRDFLELTDRLALRIIVEDAEDCYRVLGAVHHVMHPIPGKLKDYIGAPKENGYRSIHTVVYPLPGVTEQPIEIQIRTYQMDDYCEYGIAAHHLYKENSYALETHSARVNLFRNLAVLKTKARSPQEFATALRTYFDEGSLLVFDEENNLYHLKKPATALDFACLVYGKRCGRLKKIRINGRERRLDTLLRDGDVVETQFGRTFSFVREWRSLCHLPQSKALLKELKA